MLGMPRSKTTQNQPPFGKMTNSASASCGWVPQNSVTCFGKLVFRWTILHHLSYFHQACRFPLRACVHVNPSLYVSFTHVSFTANSRPDSGSGAAGNGRGGGGSSSIRSTKARQSLLPALPRRRKRRKTPATDSPTNGSTTNS